MLFRNRSRGKSAFFLGFLKDDRKKLPSEANFWQATIKNPVFFTLLPRERLRYFFAGAAAASSSAKSWIALADALSLS